jgi:DNA-binding NarL/FixJ family response regulator
LVESVRSVIESSSAATANSAFGLMRRERQVLELVAAGHPNKDIALRFAISEDTIKHHLTRMFDKVEVSNRLELAIWATERGLVS